MINTHYLTAVKYQLLASLCELTAPILKLFNLPHQIFIGLNAYCMFGLLLFCLCELISAKSTVGKNKIESFSTYFNDVFLQ